MPKLCSHLSPSSNLEKRLGFGRSKLLASVTFLLLALSSPGTLPAQEEQPARQPSPAPEQNSGEQNSGELATEGQESGDISPSAGQEKDTAKDAVKDSATDESTSQAWPKKTTLEQKVARVFGPPPGMKRLAQDARIWIDPKNKRLVVDGYVALRIGQLEMFACPAGTKEHESVIGLLTKAQYVHAGLLAIGAKPGSPVKFEPTYAPAHGSVIKIEILYVDEKGDKKRVPAQSWVREVGTQKTLDMDWVFAGSGMWKDPDTGTEQYLAESGDLICVSNFTTATLDLPVRSSQANSSLLFAAYTDRIPPEQTPVRLVLTLVDPPAPKDDAKTQQNEIKSTTSPNK